MGQIAKLKREVSHLQETLHRKQAENRRLNEHLAARTKERDASRTENQALQQRIADLESEGVDGATSGDVR